MRNIICEIFVFLMIIAGVGVLGTVITLLCKLISKEAATFWAVLFVIVGIYFGVTYYNSEKVDNVIGVSLGNAIQTLQEKGFDVEKDEEATQFDIVIAQSPEGGNWVAKGSTITLTTEKNENKTDGSETQKPPKVITKDDEPPKTEIIITSDKISGALQYEKQQDTYKYTAEVSGIYGFKFDISDVTQYYKFILRDSKNSTLKTCNSDIKDCSVELAAGETYTIDIIQKEGFINYNIEIGVPKSVTHINSNQISGNITYEKQSDGYFYTPIETGKYIFRMWISDVECDYRVVVKNSVNHIVKMWHNGIKETGVEMEKGETYLIEVQQYKGMCDYSISIE